MDIICSKIVRVNEVLDSEIIHDIESVKNKPEFDINYEHLHDYPLLMVAVLFERKELVRYLLTCPNINVNSWSHSKNAALILACRRNNVPIIKLLLNHRDINVNIQDKEGCTGLHSAQKETIKELLFDARIDIMIRNKLGYTAQKDCLSYSYCKIIRNSRYTLLLRIPNDLLCKDIVRMVVEEYI